MEPTTHSALRAMEELGYIECRKLPDNRKNIYVYLTPKGRVLKDMLVPVAEEVNRIAVRGISESAITSTRKTLPAMIENFAENEQETIRSERHQLPTHEFTGRVRREASGGVRKLPATDRRRPG